MFKTSRFLSSVLVLGIFAASAQAHEISLVGAADWHKFNLSNLPSGSTASDSSDFGYGGGVLIGLHITPQLSIEPGFLYLQQKFTDTSGVPNTDEETKEFQVPLVLRYWFSPMVSVGLGGYYGFATGNITESQTGAANATLPYAGNLKKNDYGMIGSIGMRFPLGEITKLVVDGRYLYGFKDNNDGFYNTAVSMKNREIQALVGLSFAFGGESRY